MGLAPGEDRNKKSDSMEGIQEDKDVYTKYIWNE